MEASSGRFSRAGRERGVAVFTATTAGGCGPRPHPLRDARTALAADVESIAPRCADLRECPHKRWPHRFKATNCLRRLRTTNSSDEDGAVFRENWESAIAANAAVGQSWRDWRRISRVDAKRRFVSRPVSVRAEADRACSRSRRGRHRSFVPDRGRSEGAFRMRCRRAVPRSFRHAERRSGRRPSACTRGCRRTERVRRRAVPSVRDRHRSRAHTFRAAKSSKLRTRDILEPTGLESPDPRYAMESLPTTRAASDSDCAPGLACDHDPVAPCAESGVCRTTAPLARSVTTRRASKTARQY
jgi:hypothetical protein